MRRLSVLAVAGLLLAACGSSDDSGSVLLPDDEATSAASDDASSDDSDGDASTDADDSDESASSTAPADDPSGKPVVEIPDELPTDLVVTDLVTGTGEAAEVGDTVTVHYVGVRSEDGAEFDNSYDRGEPFPVTLGLNSVIQGWELGLIGVQAGGRRQLDIPSSLAYGDQSGGVIQAGDALTFVIDVIAVDKPTPITAPPRADDATCASDGNEPRQQTFEEMQPFCIDTSATYTAEIVTNFGSITVELLPEKAPQTVNNFVMLARYHYFDDTECHRAIPEFVVQCGDPTATGTGGPGYRFPDELPLAGEYQIGSLAMANSGPDTNGSQFFIITGERGAALPPSYSLFGTVTEGLDSTVVALDAVANPADNGVPPLETIIIESVTVTES
jgi:cyclophilin family peptidyl-prolyl cis-trans isomerase/FKBP-type peptidyl-prolyl cis-trans isomerase